MGKPTAFCNEILALILNATAIATIAQNNATSPATSLYFGIHTADPGAAGTQATNEIAYTGYARVAVARSTGGFSAPASGSSSPVANVDFPVMTGGAGGTVTHAGLGTGSSGAGKLLYSGAVSPTISVVTNTIPRLTTATTITEA